MGAGSSPRISETLGVCVSALPSPGPRTIDAWYLGVLPHFSLDIAFGPSMSFHKKSTQTEQPRTSGGRILWSRGSIQDSVQPDTTLLHWVPLFNSLPKSTLYLLVSDYTGTLKFFAFSPRGATQPSLGPTPNADVQTHHSAQQDKRTPDSMTHLP